MIKSEIYSPHPLPAILNIPRHFTASAVVIAHNHILFVHHRRIGAWLPPGGHIEPGEMPHEAAERETLEETGIAVEVLSTPLPVTGDSNAFLLPQPLCVHSVLATEQGIDYYHIDFVFLCKPINSDALPEVLDTGEVISARWVPLDRFKEEVPLAKNVLEVIGIAIERLANSSGII
jgi:8-oxo-dGTP pyrophosphatase MutT (NUDIX family)